MAKLEIGDKLGYGQFCVVYEAWVVDESSGKRTGPPLAIKRMQKEAAKHPELRSRFQREGRLLGDVLSHPNIVSIVMRATTADRPYIVMPKADANLSERIEAGDAEAEDWLVLIFRQILEAIAYAHDRNVIHRDLKPRNVLLHGDVVKVTDFGTGKQLDEGTSGLTKTNAWFGTEPYMAPEQFKGMKDIGPEADVFALGKVLVHMLTGDVPDVGIPDVSFLPSRFQYFVQRCCASKPENRYSTAREALEAFDRIVSEPIVAELPEETLERLIEDWWNTPEGSAEERQAVQWIDEHIRTNHEDESMFLREIPRLPEELVDQYMDYLPQEFAQMLGIYDEHVSGSLPFEYCDTVTDFYERLFRRTSDLALKKTMLCRLFRMGKSHNRWHVRTRGLTVLSEVIDPSTVAMAADTIREERESSDWFADVAHNYPLPGAVRDAFREVG